jgi:hypothetical protein
MGVMATLSGLRSSGKATVQKIVDGTAPANTRMLWISNPRVQSDGKSLNIADYPNGVKIILDLIGSDEDIARFDFCIVLPNIDRYSSPIEEDGEEEEKEILNNVPYRNLIHWVWSRNANQVKWDVGVEQYVWQVSQELNEKFDTDVKFLGAEAWKKLARIAVSVAATCFSNTDNGESILVQKSHVDWAANFLQTCYDNEVFRLPEYVQQAKMTTTTNDEVNAIVAGLIHGQSLLMKTLNQQTDCSLFQLKAVTGLEDKVFNDVISNLVKNGLVQTTRNGIMPTRRLRLAFRAYRENQSKERLIPLSQQGGSLI